MPKKVYKINNFHGGLNNSSDPRDVDDKEITAATDVMVDEVGRVRLSGSNVAHDAPVLDNTGATGTQTPGAGLFYFSHDRKGGEDAGDAEAETADNYLALYDDSDAQVWVYSLATVDWDDDKDSNENGVINFLGKTTSAAARPCFYSVDGAVRVSTGEFSKYASGSLINDALHFLSTETTLTIDTGSHVVVGNYLQLDDEIVYVTGVSSNDVTVVRGLFGTKVVKHNDNTIVYIVNMNQWYGYLNNKLFQTKGTGLSFTDNTCDYNDDAAIGHNANPNIVAGLTVSGTGIPANSYIVQKTDPDEFQLNTATTGGAVTDGTLTFTFNDHSVYSNNKWYNNIQHLQSLDELGITLALHDANSTSPAAGQINVVNKIVVAYWFTTTKKDVGFWNGTYWVGLTPVYEGGQEGPISTVGTSPLQINEEILNIQLYITHPDIDGSDISSSDGHPLIDERIIGLKLYTKNYTSDEWFLLKEFDLLEGGEHGWATYNSLAGAAVSSGDVSTGNTLTGFWKTTSTADSLTLAAPSDTTSYGGPAESNTCTATLYLNESKGAGRVGTLRLSGFDNSPLYLEVDLSSTSSQGKAFNVVNPAAGTHKFVVELLDENFNIMARGEREQAISDSGVDASPQGGSGGSGGSYSS